MLKFQDFFTDYTKFPNHKPDFNNILKVLKCERPKENTLFEFFLNWPLKMKVAGLNELTSALDDMYIAKIEAFRKLGYDYCTVIASDFEFKHNDNRHGKDSISVNEGAVIFDRASFDTYNWESPRDYYKGRIAKLAKHLPDGMKFIVHGPCGVLENVMALVGYENLCYMVMDDSELAESVFDCVGSRLLEYYEQIIDEPSVGAIISNDDWGFNTQTMLSPSDMRKYVFKWHKRIVELAHRAGKPVILHSCGNLDAVYDDIIEDMKFDGKHSYEDNILSVEKSYDYLNGRIAVLGGIDLDFVCRSTPEEIYNRSASIVEKTKCIGYALGTGNSVPSYVPIENYLAMIAAVVFNR